MKEFFFLLKQNHSSRWDWINRKVITQITDFVLLIFDSRYCI
ncbi:unnamed protein product [Acanthoscelides obtectus]|uniref:Uncharacterized protein n=1 Tax=Acanthoscelides obtectus TaxID=200917 RepID=A0A9P0JL93_ACAOB|nr:unnamed protein product [Acanthoscelides obtectus]CAK1628985.1 hypothetical protein AOBTE_LOCUS5503 [Acanthoscelides obtectus]